MRWVAPVLLALVFLVSFALGVWLGRRPKRTVLRAMAASLCIILLKILFLNFPNLEFSVFPVGPYSYVRWWWGFLPAFVACGIGVFQMTATWRRMIVEVFAGLLFAMVGSWLVEHARADPAALGGRADKDKVCMQTSTYSCGAAAACTLLAHIGVESDEGEMAGLCGTSPGWGTDEFQVARGLNEKLPGRHAVIERTDWESLVALKSPAMATMKLTFLVDHWVVVLHAAEDGVRIADPLMGQVTLTKAEFLDRWRRAIVRVRTD